jgi:flagellar basal body rod protein FlgG
MNYGFYLAASGMLTGMRRLDVASNNMANVNTVGFKPDFAFARPRPAERVEDGLRHIDSNSLLDALGGGMLSAPSAVDFRQAPTLETNNPLDAAIIGQGFFTIQSGPGADGVRYTRDGRFTLDPDGRLVTAASGLPVLDEDGRAITLELGAPASIEASGDILQNGAVVARLGLTTFDDLTALRKAGENLFEIAPGAEAGRRNATAVLRSGAVESSGVEPVRAMLAAQNAGSDTRRAARMIQVHDQLMDRAINVFGRIG